MPGESLGAPSPDCPASSRKVLGPVDAWLHLVPTPELKLKGRIPLPQLPFLRCPADSLVRHHSTRADEDYSVCSYARLAAERGRLNARGGAWQQFVCGECHVPFTANFKSVDTDAIRFLVQVGHSPSTAHNAAAHASLDPRTHGAGGVY